jgi:hypothetical protein
MRRVRRLGIYLLICAAFCGGYALETVAQVPPPRERCDTSAKALSQDDQGRTVWLIEEDCTGLASSVTFTIALSRGAGPKTPFFKFEDASWNADYYGKTTPSAKWIARDHLEITIGAVATVLQKLDKAGNVTITYHIGHVLYESS